MSHFNESNTTVYKTSPKEFGKFGKSVSYILPYMACSMFVIKHLFFITNTNTNIFQG